MRPDGGRVPVPERVRRITPDHLPAGTLRVLVFGPGKGEAIVVQLPDERVGVVDGCREPRDPDDPEGRGDPVREYLAELAARHPEGPTKFRLAFVCLTHPHADHYAGLGRLLAAYAGKIDQAWTVISTQPRDLKSLRALAEWYALKHRQSGPAPSDRDGLARFLDALDAIRKSCHVNIEHLSTDKRLLQGTAAGYPLSIWACGPASHDVETAWNELFQIIEAERNNRPRQNLIDLEQIPNQMSGALLVSWGASRVLLAGDLLRGEHAHSGWCRASGHIDGQVQVVNVAHHASEGAHHDDLWRRMAPALAIVTPFLHATQSQPPRPEDIRRLSATSVVAITSPPAWLDSAGPGAPRPIHSQPSSSALPAHGGMKRRRSSQRHDIHNAVGVSLDAEGRITHFVLAGQADVYD